MARVSVIVPAAGSGKRFGSKENKIFHRLGNAPIFVRTLEAFTIRSDICQILLAIAPADLEETRDRFGGSLGFMGVTLVEGGATRTQSVRNALAKVKDEAELICVHDAVRPCVAQAWIDEVFAKAEKTGAAILAYHVNGTLKTVGSDGVIQTTLPRQELWEAQTPQVFRKDILQAAYATGKEATDDANLVESIGHPVAVVLGDARNIKITTPRDLAMAAAVIGSLPKPKPAGYSHPFDEGRW